MAKKAKLTKSSIDRGLRHKDQATFTLTLEQIAALDALAQRTQRSKANLAREAFDDLLAKHRETK